MIAARALTAVVLCAAALPAATLVVGAGQAYAAPAAAIAAAAPGDTVRILAGTYRGNLRLSKPLTLEGVGRPVIRGEGRDSVIEVTAEGCTLRGLAIEHSGNRLERENSGILLHAGNSRVEHNELRDILFGIYLFSSSHNTISANVIQGRSWLDRGERGAGIHIYNSTDNTFLDNTISETRDGMYIQYAYRSVMRRNHIHDVRYGLHYMYSDDNRFEENDFYRCVAGAAIMYSRRIVFRRNVFAHNRGFSSFGMLFQESDHCLAEDNTFLDNAVGLFLAAMRDTTFRRNLIAANDTAIQIFGNSLDNTFEGNNFIDNLSPIEVIGRETDTHWNGPRAGNYWNDYDGYDMDGNGIGDVPYKIQNLFQQLEGRYPRLRLYLFSPASQALALTERAVPVIEGSREYDRAPLMRPVAMPVRVPARPPVRTTPDRVALALAMLALPAAVIWKNRRKS